MSGTEWVSFLHGLTLCAHLSVQDSLGGSKDGVYSIKKIKYSPYMPCGDRISHVGFTMDVQDKIYHSYRVY